MDLYNMGRVSGKNSYFIKKRGEKMMIDKFGILKDLLYQ